MKLNPDLRLLLCALVLFASHLVHAADKAAPPPVYTAQTPAAPPATPEAAPALAAAEPAPPPAAPAKRSAADLEKLVAPIALYPDPLLATILPASVYPLEIVQAARFMTDTNNLSKLDAQPWDASVKAVARIPDAIKKLNDDISWTIELGEAFLAQDKDVMDAIQAMRGKAQKAGTLQTSPQQVVVVTNMVVEKTVEQQVVVVTNTVVQIQPASSSVVYVPSYNPAAVYYPPPAYVYNPVAPLVTFTAGVAMGAIIANNCNWSHGGCYHGDVDIDIDKNVNRNVNRDGSRNTSANAASRSSASSQKKWQPDQSRLGKSGSPSASASARSAEARGWNSGGARPSTGSSGARPSPSTGAARPSPSAGATRPSPSAGAARPSPSPNQSANRPSPSSSSSQRSAGASRQSAFDGGGSGASARQSSSRGSASRGGGGGRSGGGRGR
jgi:hypothetical protein